MQYVLVRRNQEKFSLSMKSEHKLVQKHNFENIPSVSIVQQSLSTHGK